MNVLITGGVGYVGAHVALEFLEKGHKITILDRNLSALSSSKYFEFLEVDLLDINRTNSALINRQFDVVVHCAALTNVGNSLKNPIHYFRNNVSGTINLLSALRSNAPFRFIFSSTAAVYASSSLGFVSEHNLAAPVTPYGESKRQCEEILRYISNVSQIEIIILRYFNVAGADKKLRAGPNICQSAALIPALCAKIFAGEEFEINGATYNTPDGTAVRDFIHVEDLARVHHQLATGVGPHDNLYRIYNVGYGVGHSVAEVVGAAVNLFEGPVMSKIGPKRPGDLPYVVANTEKLFETVGPLSSAGRLEDMLASTASWISKFNGLPPISLAL